ncbi:hypothetical protein N7532_003702 [Penicillium argentinense]|uniref:Xylanolytic transcriptional activator regulatory domain-containing protein n=1 Tax=Penicillium argentinense TaxID=1131581 RepID=A0A9W9FN49_9EURO|nr:uncharacterized protein N7532_003702 [Penicillium argentinense]KAJ5103173.1 hypothetical protein N7532_003702 [Penicillium argentinense]
MLAQKPAKRHYAMLHSHRPEQSGSELPNLAEINSVGSERRKSVDTAETNEPVSITNATQSLAGNHNPPAPTSIDETSNNPWSWLYTPELPEGDRLCALIEEYFAHIHPLRCFGFVHKPSFMQRLDEDVGSFRDEESLLHIICALGAKFLALNYSGQLPPESILSAGNQWAKIAKARIFMDLDDLSIEKLMTAILLYDHDLRIGSYASAFMLSGMTARMSQALQLNLESSADVLCSKPDSSPIVNEARRRLMWSCYVMDSWVGSGVNQLTLLEDRDVKIQLPCHSHNFILGIPCITETLDESKILNFVSRDMVPTDPSQNMGIESYFIRLVSSRKKVLRYVKHLDTSAPPWEHNSEFLQLSAEFDTWRRSLPQSLMWSPGAIYARKESAQLGALTLLWCTFHQTLVDLYRIGMPTLFRIQKDIQFPPDQQEFLDHCRRACFDNAREVSSILSEALRHGTKVLADTWLCIIAHDSTKVMLYFLKLNEHSTRGLSKREVEGTISLAQRNLEGLLQMRPMVATAEHCYFSVIKMMIASGIQPQIPHNTTATSHPHDETNMIPPAPGSPIQGSPENVLNPLAIYRMARTALHEKDNQCSASNSPSTQTTASPTTARSRLGRARNRNPSNMGTPQALLQSPDPTFHGIQGPGNFQNMGQLYIPQTREDPSLAMGNMGPMAAPGFGGTWDLADLAVFDILDGGIAAWTAEYLTDGQTGVDPFLFPF